MKLIEYPAPLFRTIKSTLRTGFTAAALTLLGASIVHAQALTCSAINNTTLTAYGNISVNLDAGDRILVIPNSATTAIRMTSPMGAPMQQCGTIFGPSNCTGITFTATATGTHHLEEAAGDSATLTCLAGGSATVGTIIGSVRFLLDSGNARAALPLVQFLLTGDRPQYFENLVADGAFEDVGVSRGITALALSTKQMGDSTDRQWDVWTRLNHSRLVGATAGGVQSAAAGVEFQLSDTSLVGVVASFANVDLTNGGVRMQSREFSLGPYFSHEFSDDLELNGFLVYGKPNRTLGGTNFQSTRLMAGAGIKARHVLGGVNLTSHASVYGYSDAQPAITVTGTAIAAHTTTSVSGSIGTQASFSLSDQVTGLVSVSGALSHSNDGLGTSSTHFMPQFGAGLVVNGEIGHLQFNLSTSEITAGTRDYTVSIGFSTRF